MIIDKCLGSGVSVSEQGGIRAVLSESVSPTYLETNLSTSE